MKGMKKIILKSIKKYNKRMQEKKARKQEGIQKSIEKIRNIMNKLKKTYVIIRKYNRMREYHEINKKIKKAEEKLRKYIRK